MALALADAGCDIVITRRTQETLDATARQIETKGRKAWTLKADMGAGRKMFRSKRSRWTAGPGLSI
jgi:short-subunit dehydrogenase